MLRRTFLGRVALLAGAVLVSSAAADDKKAGLSGTWTQAGADLKITFEKDTLKISPHGDKAPIAIVCKYEADKDGLVKATVSDHEGTDEFKDKIKNVVPVGVEFTFKWQAKDDTATLDEVKGDKADALKSHLEGKYEKK
jgi:hypothetical protein